MSSVILWEESCELVLNGMLDVKIYRGGSSFCLKKGPGLNTDSYTRGVYSIRLLRYSNSRCLAPPIVPSDTVIHMLSVFPPYTHVHDAKFNYDT